MLILDHIMHGITRPELLAEQLETLGLRAVAGGQHAGWGTANSLSYFGLPYLEWIWVRDAAEAEGSPIGGPIAGSVGRGDGPVTVIFRTSDLQPWVERFRGLELPALGPVECSRQRPDGSVLRWRLLLPPWPWPFLIEWAEPDSGRLAGLVQRGALVNGDLQLVGVGWAVQDLGAGAEWLERVYGLRVGAPEWDEQLGAWVAQSAAGLFLAAPGAGRTGAGGGVTDNGIVADWLESRGEGPFLYRFSGGAPRLVEPAGGLGAWLQFGSLESRTGR